MKLVPNQELANPNACTICEEQPQGDNVIDTERFTPFNPVYPLNGRKYVCERCAKEIAERLGFESGDEVQKARQAADEARAELGNVRERTTELADHIRDFVNSPVSLDPQASADALQAVFNQTDSPSASALGATDLALSKNAAPADLTAVAPREEVDTSDPEAVQSRVEPQAPNGADILENEATAAKVDSFDGNINENDNAAVVPPEFLEVNQPVERDVNNDVVGVDDQPAERNSDGTFKVNEESLKADQENADAAIEAANDPQADVNDPLAGVSEDAVQAAKDDATTSKKSSKKSK